jgi:hypothetical protein
MHFTREKIRDTTSTNNKRASAHSDPLLLPYITACTSKAEQAALSADVNVYARAGNHAQ